MPDMPERTSQAEWREYRAQCEARNAFSRFALEALIAMLDNPRHREQLAEVMRSKAPLLQFSHPQVADLLAGLEPERSGLSPGKAQHLVICWQEYLESFSARPADPA